MHLKCKFGWMELATGRLFTYGRRCRRWMTMKEKRLSVSQMGDAAVLQGSRLFGDNNRFVYGGEFSSVYHKIMRVE